MILFTGCATVKNFGLGVIGGIPEIEKYKQEGYEKFWSDKDYSTTGSVYFNSLLAIGFFVLNPIAGGAYLAGSGIYGVYRLHEPEKKK